MTIQGRPRAARCGASLRGATQRGAPPAVRLVNFLLDGQDGVGNKGSRQGEAAKPVGGRLFQIVRWRGRYGDRGAAVFPFAALLLVTAVAVAQEQGAPATTLERVVVTGSHIPQTDVETALPVQILTREDIERSGVTTVEQLLERVPANVNPFNLSRTIGNNTSPGLSSANLRGLGAFARSCC